MTDFPIPFHHQLVNFKLPSKLHFGGNIPEGANRFEVDLKSAEGEIFFHFNPRFSENCVVRSSTKDGQQWQAEEREGGMPFAAGKPYLLEMLIEENGISCSVNDNQFCFFKARDNLENLNSVEVLGDVQLNNFNVTSIGFVVIDESAGKVPRETEITGGGGEIPEPTPTQPVAPVPGPQGQLPIPYQGPLDTLLTTNRMRVVGTPHPGAQRFTVNWKSADGETLFHFNTRFDPGKQFALDFLLHGDIIRAREDLHKVVLLDIHGDIALDQVLIA
uniref:Galectin n=1 Tax=Meloidogyne hapla TaxID=6305 RepID=A0A1I8BJ70_MELHA